MEIFFEFMSIKNVFIDLLVLVLILLMAFIMKDGFDDLDIVDFRKKKNDNLLKIKGYTKILVTILFGFFFIIILVYRNL
jgi:hypothetical protein